MTTSILDDVLKLKNDTPEKLQEYFQSINLPLFDTIFHSSQNLKEAKQKVLFIIIAYSEDSPLLILRQDSKEEKEGICDYLQMPDFMRHKLMQLTEPEVRKATTQYLTQFAGPLFKSLMFMKIQRDDLDLDITNRAFVVKKITKSEGGAEVTEETYDPKAHGAAVAERARLSKNIDAIEKEIRAQVKRMEGIDDLKNFVRDGKDAGRIKGVRTGNVEGAIC